jgi:hypothetical protein
MDTRRFRYWSIADLLGFLLASEVAEGETRAFDERILLLFRVPGDLSVPIGPSWLKEAMRDITALGSTSVLTIVVGGAAWRYPALATLP